MDPNRARLAPNWTNQGLFNQYILAPQAKFVLKTDLKFTFFVLISANLVNLGPNLTSICNCTKKEGCKRVKETSHCVQKKSNEDSVCLRDI